MHKLGYVLLQLEPTPPDIPLVFELGVGFPPKLGFHVFWEMMEEYRSKVGPKLARRSRRREATRLGWDSIIILCFYMMAAETSPPHYKTTEAAII